MDLVIKKFDKLSEEEQQEIQDAISGITTDFIIINTKFVNPKEVKTFNKGYLEGYECAFKDFTRIAKVNIKKMRLKNAN